MLKPETVTKLATALAEDVDLYNEVTAEISSNDKTISEKDQLIEAGNSRIKELEEKNVKFAEQISNLASKIPVGASQAPASMEQQMQEIKDRAWSK